MQAHYSSLINMINCTFYKNLASATLFEIMDSNFNAINVYFIENFNNLIDSSSSTLEFKNISIFNHECFIESEGCIMLISDNSLTKMMNSILYNISTNNQNNILIVFSIIELDDVKFNRTCSELRIGSCLSGISSSITINNSIFHYFTGNAIFLERTFIGMKNTVVSQNNEHSESIVKNKFGAFVCLECENYNVENSFFSDNSNTREGSAMYLANNVIIPGNHSLKKIVNTTFLKNIAYQTGGALYILNQNLMIDECKFLYNNALNGGGIFSLLVGIYRFKSF